MLEPKANERERLCARPPPFHDSFYGNDGERMRDLTKYLTGLLLLRFGKGYRKSGSDYLRICSSVVLGKARMDVEIRKVSFVSLVVYFLTFLFFTWKFWRSQNGIIKISKDKKRIFK